MSSSDETKNQEYTHTSDAKGVHTVTTVAVQGDAVYLGKTEATDKTFKHDGITVLADGRIESSEGTVFLTEKPSYSMPGTKTTNAGVDPKIAEQVRGAIQGFLKDGVIDAKEAGKIGELVDKVQAALPRSSEKTGMTF